MVSVEHANLTHNNQTSYLGSGQKIESPEFQSSLWKPQSRCINLEKHERLSSPPEQKRASPQCCNLNWNMDFMFKNAGST